MGTGVGDEADFARRCAEGDEVLAQDADAHGRRIGRSELVGSHGRKPVLTEQVAHDGAGTDAREGVVIVGAEHGGLPNEVWTQFRAKRRISGGLQEGSVSLHLEGFRLCSLQDEILQLWFERPCF